MFTFNFYFNWLIPTYEIYMKIFLLRVTPIIENGQSGNYDSETCFVFILLIKLIPEDSNLCDYMSTLLHRFDA